MQAAEAGAAPGVGAAHAVVLDADLERVAALDAEADVGKRKGLAVQAAALMQEETPALIPYWQRELRIVREGVVGVAPGPNVVWDPAPVGVTTI